MSLCTHRFLHYVDGFRKIGQPSAKGFISMSFPSDDLVVDNVCFDGISKIPQLSRKSLFSYIGSVLYVLFYT